MRNWPLTVLSNELRKILSYRIEFWVNFLGQTLVSITVAYFLWTAIFAENQTDVMNGFTLPKMMMYYLVAPLVFRSLQGESIGYISTEIYEGGLNKYLIYPISFIFYKKITYFTHSSFYLCQLLIVALICKLTFYPNIAFGLLIACLLATLISGLVYFAMSSILEMIAFWADNIWSLSVMLRLIVSSLGGAMIPLAFFPDWATKLLDFTPFPYMVNFPIAVFFGEISFQAFIQNSCILLLWYCFFMLIGRLVWNRAQLQYSGVGI